MATNPICMESLRAVLDERDAEMAELKAEIARLREALKQIMQHQETISPATIRVSATYLIAMQALKGGVSDE